MCRMRAVIDLPEEVMGGVYRYMSDKGLPSVSSAVAHLLIRALAHFGYL
jgi:hypothetical protein